MPRAVIFRQLDVQPGVEGQRGGFGRIVGNAVMLVQQADAAVVRHNNAVEAPLFAQDGGQQEAVAVPRLVIDVVVGGHDRTGVCQLDRHFKRQQEGVVQLAKAKMYRRMVARSFAERVAHVVLERRQQVALIAL